MPVYNLGYGMEAFRGNWDMHCPECDSTKNQTQLQRVNWSHTPEHKSIIRMVGWCQCGCVYVVDYPFRNQPVTLYNFSNHKTPIAQLMGLMVTETIQTIGENMQDTKE